MAMLKQINYYQDRNGFHTERIMLLARNNKRRSIRLRYMKKNNFISNWFFCSLFFLVSAITHAQVTSKVNSGIYKTIYEMLREVPGLDVKISNDRSGGTIIV